MSKIPFKRILPALAALCLFFCCSSPIFARMPQQEPTPAEPQQPTTVPTLPAELYSQTATPGLDGGIRHTVLDGQFLITIAEMYGITLNDLLTLNNLTVDSIILPGDILIIREGGEITLGRAHRHARRPSPIINPRRQPNTNLHARSGVGGAHP